MERKVYIWKSNNIIGKSNMKLENIFRVLKAYRRDIGATYTIRELSERIGLSYEPTHRHVNSLVAEGVLGKNRVGKAYEIGLKDTEKTKTYLSLLTEEEREELFGRKSSAGKIVDEFLSGVKEELGERLQSVVLFGSYARGGGTERSDIDLLTLSSSLKDKGVVDRIASTIEMRYGKSISTVVADLESMKKMLASETSTVGTEALTDGIIIFGHKRFWDIVFEVKL
ncbi:MAG: nucleotidyltransferase domain-containing protein [archaeon]